MSGLRGHPSSRGLGMKIHPSYSPLMSPGFMLGVNGIGGLWGFTIVEGEIRPVRLVMKRSDEDSL